LFILPISNFKGHCLRIKLALRSAQGWKFTAAEAGLPINTFWGISDESLIDPSEIAARANFMYTDGLGPYYDSDYHYADFNLDPEEDYWF
jgi:hypothetical protein